MKKITFAFLLICLVIVGCEKNDNPQPEQIVATSGVYVCNEGNFMSGNSSLTFYDYATSTTSQEVFYKANRVPLGDVCNRMVLIDNTAYIIVNNSGKIYAVDPKNLNVISVYEGLTSPRQIAFAGNSLFVTNLYGPLTILNPQSGLITGSISLGTAAEGSVEMYGNEDIIVIGNYAYVNSWTNNRRIYKINVSTQKLESALEVGIQPNSMVVDKNGRLWVLCDGAYYGSSYDYQTASLCCVNLDNFTIEKTYTFPEIGNSPSKLSINPNKDILYFLNGDYSTSGTMGSGVFSMSINAANFPTSPLIAQGQASFYGLGIDPVSGDIFVSDAKDYVSAGVAYHYNAEAILLGQFATGICPGSFCFIK